MLHLKPGPGTLAEGGPRWSRASAKGPGAWPAGAGAGDCWFESREVPGWPVPTARGKGRAVMGGWGGSRQAGLSLQAGWSTPCASGRGCVALARTRTAGSLPAGAAAGAGEEGALSGAAAGVPVEAAGRAPGLEDRGCLGRRTPSWHSGPCQPPACSLRPHLRHPPAVVGVRPPSTSAAECRGTRRGRSSRSTRLWRGCPLHGEAVGPAAQAAVAGGGEGWRGVKGVKGGQRPRTARGRH